MTSPQVSEQEVEAAAEAICATSGRKICHPDAMAHCLCRGHARAALTAAAQVRERADMEALQRAAARDQPMICRWCNQMHRGGPENCNNPDATYTKAQSVEPDSGPDVLGERKE